MPENAKVIIVEDDELVIEPTLEALERGGHQVVFTASDLHTARQRLKELSTSPDVALIDTTFPTTPGGSIYSTAGGVFALELRNVYPQTQIVAFTQRLSSAIVRDFRHNLRFPEEGDFKTPPIIGKHLSDFITNLPSIARE